MKSAIFILLSVFSMLTSGAQFKDYKGPFQLAGTKEYEDSIVSLANLVQEKWGSKKRTVIIVDFSKPMEVDRLYVVDLDLGKIIKSTKVCHGVGSGKTSVPIEFSNKVDSKMSTKGVMRTAESYTGQWGYSMRVDGLQNINSKVRSRAIVFHNAQVQHTAWSWGCFSMPNENYKEVIDLTKGGSLIFVFSNSSDIKSF